MRKESLSVGSTVVHFDAETFVFEPEEESRLKSLFLYGYGSEALVVTAIKRDHNFDHLPSGNEIPAEALSNGALSGYAFDRTPGKVWHVTVENRSPITVRTHVVAHFRSS